MTAERDRVLVLPRDARAAIAAWSTCAYPREACGVLIGHRRGAERVIVRAEHGRNQALEEDRFELDPAELVAIDARAREQGLEILGLWHSHPDRPATPSSADHRTEWGSIAHLIAAVGRSGLADLRAWRLVKGKSPEELLVEDADHA